MARFCFPGSKAEEILEQFLEAFALPEVVAKLATRCLPQATTIIQEDGGVGFDLGTPKKPHVASQRLVDVGGIFSECSIAVILTLVLIDVASANRPFMGVSINGGIPYHHPF